MKHKQLFLIAVLAVVLLPTTLLAVNDTNNQGPMANFAGMYFCRGHDNLINVDYTGFVNIKPDGEIFSLMWTYGQKWRINNQDLQYHGTGFLIDKRKDLLASAYWNAKDPKELGIEVYRLQPDKTLKGEWALKGNTKINYETCVKAKAVN